MKRLTLRRALRRSAFATLLLTAVATLYFLVVPVTSAAVDCSVSADKVSLDADEQRMLQLINEYRASNGLAALTVSPALSQAAAFLAEDMAQRRAMSHTDRFGRSLNRLRDCGYPYAAGENVAWGTGALGGPDRIFSGWRGSAGHNANMLGTYRAVGIAKECSSGACFWALDVGAVVDSGGSPPPPTSTVPQVTGTNSGSQAGVTTPTYTYQTSPSTSWGPSGYRTYWIYSNGRWFGYSPSWRWVSDLYNASRTGVYYYFR